ncbi:MAG TPA: hypothetical protein VFZ40_11910 [Pyrinomonadaceae bacterium]
MKRKPHIPVLLSLAVFACAVSLAQDARQTETSKQPACRPEEALTIIEQEIDSTKTFNDDARRVEVLIRAADVLWAYQEENARKAYAEAFNLAKRHFNEKGDHPAREGKLLVSTADQRYVVISSIARHDSNWSKKLTTDLLKEQEDEASTKSVKDAQRAERTAERLLTVATSLLPADEAASLSFARSSLRFPATMYLTPFLYTFSTRSKSAADQFYQEALAAYSNAPMERLLYLSAYPFGNDRDAGDTPGYMLYRVPADFTPNPNLQRLFVQRILQRVQSFINNPSEVSPDARVSDPEEMWLALTGLEKQIQQTLPDLASAVEVARNNVAARLSQPSQRDVQRTLARDSRPVRTFEEQVESALKNPNVDARDQQLTSAVINSSKNESVGDVLQVVDGISDSNIRQPLLNWFFFDRSQRALKEQKLADAKNFAARVDELDQRAFLYSQIAEEALKLNADQTRARDILEDIIAAAAKAPNTTVKARALFTVAFLFTRIDMNRAVAVMAEAVDCVNRIEHADFTRQFVIRKIEGKTFGMYASIATPGYKPETALAEIATVDFDNMLNQASRFSDKALRAITTLAIVERCLKSVSSRSKKVATQPQ